MTQHSIIEAADEAGYCAFASALRATDYVSELNGKGPFTVFAPSDEAFGKFSTQAMEGLLDGGRDLFRLVMGYHFASGKVNAAQFKGKRIRARMHAGGHLVINGRGGLRANAAHIVEPDIEAANGVIHGLDAVLWPSQPVLAAAGWPQPNALHQLNAAYSPLSNPR